MIPTRTTARSASQLRTPQESLPAAAQCANHPAVSVPFRGRCPQCALDQDAQWGQMSPIERRLAEGRADSTRVPPPLENPVMPIYRKPKRRRRRPPVAAAWVVSSLALSLAAGMAGRVYNVPPLLVTIGIGASYGLAYAILATLQRRKQQP